MILARPTVIIAALLALGLTGCLSLPKPAPATARSGQGDPAPVFTLARTGPTPGRLVMSELWQGSPAVLVFYRGEW